MRINTLYEDLQENTDYQNDFNNFISNVYNNIEMLLTAGPLNVPTQILNFWNTYILTNNFALLEQYLYFKVYAYETDYLLIMWNASPYKIATQIFFKLYKTVATYITSNDLLLSQINNYSVYGLTSQLNSQSNNLNSDSTNDTTGTLNISNTVTNQENVTLPASNIDINVNDINSSQTNNQSVTFNGIDILEAILKIQKDIELYLNDILKDIFKPFEAPFYASLEPKKGTGW